MHALHVLNVWYTCAYISTCITCVNVWFACALHVHCMLFACVHVLHVLEV